MTPTVRACVGTQALARTLDARQYALKLIANVTWVLCGAETWRGGLGWDGMGWGVQRCAPGLHSCLGAAACEQGSACTRACTRT